MSLQCLVFDCDGVILDSVPVKTRAFGRLMEPFGPEARDRFLMYHKVHGGVSRYKKFEWFYEDVLGKTITPDESEGLGNRFAEYVLDELRRCELIPGIQETLDSWRGKLPMLRGLYTIYADRFLDAVNRDAASKGFTPEQIRQLHMPS